MKLPKFLSGKPTALEIISGADWKCSQCDEIHSGISDLVADRPCQCPDELPIEHNGALRKDGDFLSEDFCVLGGENFFIRGVLEIPIQKSDEYFGFGSWSTLSRENFELYLSEFDEGLTNTDLSWFGWFSTSISGIAEEMPLGCTVVPQTQRQRPRFWINGDEHPLVEMQENGIGAERLLQIYAAYGHAMN